MYRLLSDGIVKKHDTFENALIEAQQLQSEWSILDPNSEVIFDWIEHSKKQ